MQVNVSVIILNWNGRQFLEPCLESLQAQTYPEFEVVLVENGSSDGSGDFVRQRFDDWLAEGRLKLIELPQNLGFAGGNLAGLEQVCKNTRYIATLNNDTIADPLWLEKLVSSFESKPLSERWGAACGPMVFASNKELIASAGIEFRRDGVALDRHIGRQVSAENCEQELFGPCAGAAIYRHQAIEECGFFDPAFFAYLEDADLAWRLKLAGWRTLYVPEAVVQHSYSGSGKQGSPFKNYQLGRNRLWVILKNMPLPLLLKNCFHIFFYDITACLYTLIIQRDIHPIRGRLAALHPRHLRRIFKQRRDIQSGRSVSLELLENWLTPVPSITSNIKLRKSVDRLAMSHTEVTEK